MYLAMNWVLKRYICYNKDLYVLMQLLVHYFCMGNW